MAAAEPLWSQVVTAGTRREEVLSAIVRELGQYVGASMAGASARMHMEKLRLGAVLSAAELNRLLDALAPGLHVFLGRRKTEDVVYLIRKALLEGSPK
jgi:hypothetical protein